MKETANSNDRRIRKTKQSIRTAFTQLIMEKDFSEITVKEIASYADISRRTFYMHYDSIDDILNEMNLELSENVNAILYNIDYACAQIADIKSIFQQLNDVLNRNYAFYKRLASIHSYAFFIQMLSASLCDIIEKILADTFHRDSKVNSAYAQYFSAGIIALYVNWLNSDSDQSLDQLVNVAAEITYGGISSLLR